MRPTKGRRGWVLLCAVWLLVAAPASAQTEDSVTAEARRHFDAGSAFYKAGKYKEAIAEFDAGYNLSRRALFLLNLGQAYRRLDDLEHAQLMYERFLDHAPDDAPERPAVNAILADIRAKRAAREPRPIPTLDAVAPAPVPVVAAAPPPPRKSFVRRHWWIFPVGAVVVGTALGVGIYFGLHPPHKGLDCGAATLGCIQEAPR